MAARIFFICCSTRDKFAAGLGQSVPFMKAGFHMPRVTSAEKQLAMVTNDAGKKSARSLRPEIKKKEKSNYTANSLNKY